MGWDCRDGIMDDGYICRGGYVRNYYGMVIAAIVVAPPAWYAYTLLRNWRMEYYRYGGDRASGRATLR